MATIRALLVVFLLLPAAAWAQSSYGGSWRGRWVDAGNRQSGLVVLTIDDRGGIGGQVGNGALGALAPLSGRVEQGGATFLTYTYDDGYTFFRASGRMRRRGRRLTGVLDFITPQGGWLGRGVFTLEPDAG